MNSDKKEFVLPAKSIMQKEEKRGSILVESSGEFVLPDYMPKVQKVLRIEARALPPTYYIGVADAQMSGNVLHTIVYLGEDGEISATVLPSKYEFSVPLSKSETAPNLTAAVEVESVNHRLGGPRKINIRTRLTAQPIVFFTEDITPEKLTDDDSVHKLYCELDCKKTAVIRTNDIGISDSIETSPVEDAKLLWCGSTSAVSDIRVMDGGVSVRGDVMAKVLLDEGGIPKMYTKKIPFDEFVDGDIDKGASAIATAKVVSTEASREESGEVLVEISIMIETIVDTPCRISTVKDAFSVVGEGKTEYRNVRAEKHIVSRSGVFNVGGSLPKSVVGAEDVLSVADTSGEAVIDDVITAKDRITANGRCLLNSIFVTENGAVSADYSVPFSITLNCENVENAEVMCIASLFHAKTRVDGESLICDMDIALSMRAFAVVEENVLSEADYSTVKNFSKSAYPVCLIYPNGESLWSLAKKYHVSPTALAKVNSLEIEEKDYTSPQALESSSVLMLELK
ncbi:MAG: hypothetical protein IJA60_00195 [Clostridia bacterium]|nr:hypothetical protein [Clostridia bacterium]